ncbi:hypothetical protein PVK06_013821 [Gossypium arboreum]|uniref:Uncharacterized protein n=1 Tax=Gossypium arboreum TaxID=29729 RepID=A0ABR0PTC0_GOSAR|nr:hypothetical protein PVK06_013821 [Gossypium arboreum]
MKLKGKRRVKLSGGYGGIIQRDKVEMETVQKQNKRESNSKERESKWALGEGRRQAWLISTESIPFLLESPRMGKENGGKSKKKRKGTGGFDFDLLIPDGSQIGV